MAKAGAGWIWKMAWRDSRRNRGRLLLFISAITVGIAVLVAINSLRNSLESEITSEARNLLGADLKLESYYPPNDSLAKVLRTLGAERATSKAFASMIYFPKNGQSRLMQVRALEGEYPFYGSFDVSPADADSTFRLGTYALVDGGVMTQYGLQPGDSVKVGQKLFTIKGSLNTVPGQPGITSAISPRIFIPMQYLEATDLIQKGSRVFYRYYFKLDKETSPESVLAEIEPLLNSNSFRSETVKENQRDTGEALSNLTSFLNLVGFIALLLGAVGVAGTVSVYIKGKRETVAILRNLGASGSQAFRIFLTQILVMSAGGAIIGAALGSALQLYLPQLLQDFLPVQAEFALSPSAIIQGILVGVVMALLFALIPLLKIRNVSPLQSIRAEYQESGTNTGSTWWVYALIGLFIFGFTLWQIRELEYAVYFTLGLAGAFGLLAAAGYGLMWSVRKFFPKTWPYTWRQSLANLFRPNNQTLILVVTIGLGAGLLVTLFLSRTLLLNQIEFSADKNDPNIVLFDIQSSQKKGIRDFVESRDMPIMQYVPIVTMRLDELKGKSREELVRDTGKAIYDQPLNREYRVTYRDTLDKTEELTAGNIQQVRNDSVFITISEQYAQDDLQVDIGDEIVFDVQGAKIETYVGGFREIDWRRVQPNFLVVFPTGVLEKAPQFHVLVTRVDSSQNTAAFQQAVVEQFPNVSVIDLKLILETATDVLGKVSFVIRFMAAFSILTGLLVLVSSIFISRYQRVRESVLLRTLGANRKQVITINTLEYLFLGIIATFTGLLISIIASYLLAKFVFEVPFVFSFLPILATLVIIIALIVVLGWLNSRTVVNQPPLEVLRKEVG